MQSARSELVEALAIARTGDFDYAEKMAGWAQRDLWWARACILKSPGSYGRLVNAA